MKYKKYLGFSSKLSLIMYILFISYYIFCWYNMLILHNGKENQQWDYDHYYACIDYLSTDDLSEKEKIVAKYNYLGFSNETCNNITQYGTTSNSVYNTYEEFLSEENFIFPFFIPLIVLLPFLYLISKEMKNKIVKNYALRDSYINYVKYIFKTAYKNIFIIPIIILVTFAISFLVSNGNMNASADIGLHNVLPNLLFIDNPAFYILFVLVMFLSIGLYINIGLIVLSKNKNFLVTILESELIIFLIWCFSLIGFGRFFKIFGINPDNFNLLSLYDWGGIDNMYIYFAVNLILFVITFVIAIKSYKNKEKIILMCEK